MKQISFFHRTALVKSFPKHSVGAEIGVQVAKFSRVILNAVEPSLLYLVDCWVAQDVPYDTGKPTHDKCKEMALREVAAEIEEGIVKILPLFSHEAAKLVPDESLDWVYIDAGHMYEECLSDLRLWYPKVKHGGVIAGHDYLEDVPFVGVCQAVADFMEEENLVDLNVTWEHRASFYFEKP